MNHDVFWRDHCFFISPSLVRTRAISLRSDLTLPFSFRSVPLDASTRSFARSERNCPSLSLRSVSLNSRIVFIFSRVITLAPLQLHHKFLWFRLFFLLVQLPRFHFLA